MMLRVYLLETCIIPVFAFAVALLSRAFPISLGRLTGLHTNYVHIDTMWVRLGINVRIHLE